MVHWDENHCEAGFRLRLAFCLALLSAFAQIPQTGSVKSHNARQVRLLSLAIIMDLALNLVEQSNV